MEDYVFSNDFTKNIDDMIYTCGYESCESGHSYVCYCTNKLRMHQAWEAQRAVKEAEKVPFPAD